MLSKSTPLSRKDGETFYKTQVELMKQEKKTLQERLEILEKENRELKKSVHELTLAIENGAKGQVGGGYNTQFVFDIDAALDGDTNRIEHSTDNEPSGQEEIRFSCKINLEAHAGAVYCLAFSPCGRFLASGSFDKSVRVWKVENASDRPSVSIHSAHDASIIDLAWSSDSTLAYSGGYDKYVKEWDVASGRSTPLTTFSTSGMVQAIQISRSDNLIYVATTANTITWFDRRAPGGDEESAGVLKNDSNVNTIYLSNDNSTITSGDRLGFIKTWDLRKADTRPTSVTENGPERRPITHVHASPVLRGEDEGRLLAVNSYDNYLRVYSRGERLLGGSPSAMRVQHVLRGHHNRNWPIRSSFYSGKDYRPYRETAGWNSTNAHEADDFEFTTEEEVSEYKKAIGINGSLLLATGSVDGNAYLFDISGGSGTSKLIQVLEGHQGRCYSVDFHPSEPVLASCSADSIVKLWKLSRASSGANS
uniref:Coronin n=2 Tax=Rhodosorus marinus TaxID=101924 RepID=A0A7S2ZY62_9RHOD|mmetsp:Transcript_36051/g.144133  ORF Transcript_36051/g.144133 Transcript_36051/m.144133 type:complete len:478 (+) Transcript_36051:89-1522(+)